MAGEHEITVDQWRGMRDAGARGELLDGQVVVMPDPGPAHVDCLNRLNRLLLETLAGKAVVSVQNPVVLDERSEPRPDLSVLKTTVDPSAHPGPGDVLLLIEVSESPKFLAYDRGRKASYYARSGIPECWVVDVPGQQVLMLRSPASGGYRDIRNVPPSATIGIERLPDVELGVAAILGR